MTAAIVLTVVAALATGACRPAPRGSHVAPAPGRQTVITEAEIVRMGVTTAWDVLRLKAPRIVFVPSEQGRPADVRIQEPTSINADETPLLVVDGQQMADLSYLHQLPASEVRMIWILSSEAAQPRYGLRAAGGAVIVVTKSLQ